MWGEPREKERKRLENESGEKEEARGRDALVHRGEEEGKKIRASRRSQVDADREKSIPGREGRSQVRAGKGATPFLGCTGAKMIIRRHGNARPTSFPFYAIFYSTLPSTPVTTDRPSPPSLRTFIPLAIHTKLPPDSLFSLSLSFSCSLAFSFSLDYPVFRGRTNGAREIAFSSF